MIDSSTAECVVAYDPSVEMAGSGKRLLLLLKTIPWTRVMVDLMLIAAILLVSSSFLSVK
jgi:hypothetical protein